MSTGAEPPSEIDQLVQRFLDRRSRRRIASPSPRQPHRSRHFNHADLIEAQLQEDGHRTWGFVIYRTTYASDEEWSELLRRLKLRMEETFDGYNGGDILDLFTLTVIEDRQILEDASTEIVRDHFVQWRANAPQLDQARDDKTTSDVITAGQSPRYRYAIQVDDASLHSIVHDAPAPPEIDTMKRGWVKLLDALWMPSERVRWPYEPIEGITEHDVGWMKIPYQDTVEYYIRCRDLNYWVTSYQRPPAIMGWPYGA